MLTLMPPELLINILHNVDARNLSGCRMVCKLFRDLIDQTASLTYAIELEIAGQRDRYSKLPASDKLKLLREQQSSWENCRWNQELTIPICGGGLWELFGNVLAQQSVDRTSLVFRQLPSVHRGIADREWSVKIDGPLVRDFGIDPAQDLLVLIEAPRWWGPNPDHTHRIHMRSLLDGTIHPLAANSSTIIHRQGFRDLQISYSIQVSGDLLGIFFRTVEAGENEFIIWEWKTGSMKLYLSGDEMRSFCFLSERHVLLIVFNLPDTDEVQPSLMVVDFGQESAQKQHHSHLQHSFGLAFPAFESSVAPLYISVRSDPSPTWSAHPSLEVPFEITHHNKLFVISVWVQSDASIRYLTLFVPQKTLLSHLDAMGAENRMLQWEAWGPKGTRLIDLQQAHSMVWACYVYGSRYVAPECGTRTKRMNTVHVYDFNEPALRHAISQNCQRPADSDSSSLTSLELDSTLTITAATIFRAGYIFKQEVKTWLPYRIRVVSLPSMLSRSSLMCSEDSLIVVNHNGQEAPSFRVFVF